MYEFVCGYAKSSRSKCTATGARVCVCAMRVSYVCVHGECGGHFEAAGRPLGEVATMLERAYECDHRLDLRCFRSYLDLFPATFCLVERNDEQGRTHHMLYLRGLQDTPAARARGELWRLLCRGPEPGMSCIPSDALTKPLHPDAFAKHMAVIMGRKCLQWRTPTEPAQ